MKKIILLALIVLMVVGCENERLIEKVNGADVVTIDSCEYISSFTYCGHYVYSHKGNCRFCEQRDSIKWEQRKKELEEFVKLN